MKRAEGDGRQKIKALPQYIVAGTRPLDVTRAQARRVIDAFESDGHSCHSGQGGMLWVILEHCADEGIPYRIDCHSEYPGYYVAKTKKPS